MDEQSESTALQEHTVLFLDFLGFADAVQQWDDTRLEKLIGLLVSIAGQQSAFDISGEPQPDGSYKITSPAEITTFSDHIVASYPTLKKSSDTPLDLWETFSNGWTGMVLHQMQKITAHVAIAALDVGLLVRGGLSRGKLYHSGAVVMGEAMVDAYRLESTVARSPRIVVSPRISDDELRLYTDSDGKRCLDYIREMLLVAEDKHGDAQAWARQRLREIESTMDALAARNRTNEAAKWMYFRDTLHRAAEIWS
jgi:hypothetical protein